MLLINQRLGLDRAAAGKSVEELESQSGHEQDEPASKASRRASQVAEEQESQPREQKVCSRRAERHALASAACVSLMKRVGFLFHAGTCVSAKAARMTSWRVAASVRSVVRRPPRSSKSSCRVRKSTRKCGRPRRIGGKSGRIIDF
jgi:hypothetical protein